MIYKVLSFITDGLGNVFIPTDGSMSERQVYMEQEYITKPNSVSMPGFAALAIRDAYSDIANCVAVLPCYVENSKSLENIRFCLIVADENEINKKEIPLKVPFSLLLDGHTAHIQRSPNEDNLVMTNFFFELSTKMSASLHATSAQDFVKRLSSGFSGIRLICPICKSIALRESLVVPSGGFFQEIKCSNTSGKDCGFHIRKKETNSDSWKEIINNWNLLHKSN